MKLGLTRPKKLEVGDTIGIVAPSAGLAGLFKHRVDNAVKVLNQLGYKVKFAKNSLNIDGYVSAKAKERAEDIHEMFSDNEVKAIICTIGGNHSNQILKYLNFNIIKDNPKIFLGYSDISVLHYAFLKKARLGTFYGPCLMTQFGEYPSILPYTLEYFNKALTSNKKIGKIIPSEKWTDEVLDWSKKKDLERPRKLIKSSGYDWLKKGRVSAQIIGGCVPSINHTIGTEYWVETSGKVFFIDIPEGEDIGKGLSIESLDSYLADLDNLGVFENISGLIIGRPYNYSKQEYQKLKEIILYYTKNNNYPVLLKANIGHSDPIITLPLNVKVTLDSSKNLFSIDEPGVR